VIAAPRHGSGPTRTLDLDEVERGILLPVVYASVFNAPVRVTRLWSQVAGIAVSEEVLGKALRGPALRSLLAEQDGLVWLRSIASPDTTRAFLGREAATADLLGRHRDILSFLKQMRGIRFAGLSGGCAHDAADDGDIDVFVVTEVGFLWRTLLWSTLVAKARGWRRLLCLNYLVDESAQALPWRDFYGAFELISLRPIRGEEALAGLLGANRWAEPLFPNFFQSRLNGQNLSHIKPQSRRPSLLEVAARMIHRPYLRYRLPQGSGVELSDHVVRLHATDHRTRLRGLFRDALQRTGMEAPSWT
jgi:hypothetical protein